MSRLEILDDREEKARLRRKIKETLERAEYLKETIRPVSEEPLPSSSKAVSEWSDIPQVSFHFDIYQINRPPHKFYNLVQFVGYRKINLRTAIFF